MILIIVKDDKDKTRHHVWDLDKKVVPSFRVDRVVELSANDKELKMILEKCTNIPYHDGKSMTWYGDHAKFIAGNLHRMWKS